MWIPNSFYPSFIALALNIFFALYILHVGIRKPGNLVSFLLFLTIAVGVAGEVVERVAGPPPEDMHMAYAGSLLIALSGSFLPAVLIHFGMDFPYRARLSRFARELVLLSLYAFSFTGAFLTVFNDALGAPMVTGVYPYSALGQRVWGMHYGGAYYVYLLASLLCGFALLAILYTKMRKARIKVLRYQIKFVLLGLLVVYILITTTVVIPAVLGYDVYPLSSLSLTVFGMFIIYTVARYHLFVVSPVRETGKVMERKRQFERGTVMILSPEEGYDVFAEQVHGGIPGLLFTVDEIERVRVRYGFMRTPVFRIARKQGKDTLNPSIPEHKEMVPFIISEFLEQSSSGVVFLDRVDSVWDSMFIEFATIIMDFVREEKLGVLLIAPQNKEVRDALSEANDGQNIN